MVCFGSLRFRLRASLRRKEEKVFILLPQA
jgi:hypothetical protein